VASFWPEVAKHKFSNSDPCSPSVTTTERRAPPLDPRFKGVTFRGVPRITQFLRVHLDEPELTEATVRGWISHKKIRAYRFGAQLTAKAEELVEDLAGKAA
jgi:hypothetical protein